jgi:hypothetical protein
MSAESVEELSALIVLSGLLGFPMSKKGQKEHERFVNLLMQAHGPLGYEHAFVPVVFCRTMWDI